MLYRHVFDEISTEFRGISRIYLNFAAPRMRDISEALYRGQRIPLTVYMYCRALSLNQLMWEKKWSCSRIIEHFPKSYYQFIVQGTFANHFRENFELHYWKFSELRVSKSLALDSKKVVGILKGVHFFWRGPTKYIRCKVCRTYLTTLYIQYIH